MKIIFLDIDGVMVTTRSMIPSDKYFGHQFDPSCVQHLNKIVAITHANVVISSSWREGRTLSQLKSIFQENGIGDCIVGMTPCLGEGVIRGREIQTYLNDCSDVDAFIIIDDEEEMGELEPFLIETSFRSGITESVKDKAIQMLSSSFIKEPN